MIHSNVVEYTIKNKQNTGDKGWSPAQNRIELLDITGVTKKNRNILILSQYTIHWLDVSTHNSSKTKIVPSNCRSEMKMAKKT
jgi:hypothetical protein